MVCGLGGFAGCFSFRWLVRYVFCGCRFWGSVVLFFGLFCRWWDGLVSGFDTCWCGWGLSWYSGTSFGWFSGFSWIVVGGVCGSFLFGGWVRGVSGSW